MITDNEGQVLGRLAMIRAHGWTEEAYGHMLVLDMRDSNQNILRTDFGWGDIPDQPEYEQQPFTQLMGRIAFIRAHGWHLRMIGPLDALDFAGNNALLVGHPVIEAMGMIDAAIRELDIIEHDNGGCPRMRFAEDSITRAYGVVSEFIDKIDCYICIQRDY